MILNFLAGDVWPEITKACRTEGPRSAAIAYIGAHAPDLLPLKRGDVLVCDASDGVLLGHGTSPEALQQFLDRGVQVWSYRGLHAKVLVTSSIAVVGSANASHHSTLIEEAVVVTDKASVMAQAQGFIKGLVQATPVDDLFIEAARVTWARGRSGPMAGTRRASAARPLLPEAFRLYLEGVEWYEPSKSELAVVQRESRRARRQVGPASMYALDSYRVDDSDPPFRRGDVLIQVDADGDDPLLWPPEVVISDPVPVRGGGRRLHLTKRLVDLEPIDLDGARSQLAAAGVSAQLGRERWVRSAPVRAALLGLWGLSEAAER